MRGDKFTNTKLSEKSSKEVPQRIEFDDKKYISCVIKNTSLSLQTLWVGVNSDECLEPLEPGESFPIAAREDAYLRGYLSVAWDDPASLDEKYGIVTFGVDAGEIKNC